LPTFIIGKIVSFQFLFEPQRNQDAKMFSLFLSAFAAFYFEP